MQWQCLQIIMTHGGVSNPIIIICARALKKDHPHWVNGRASTNPAIASQLSGGKS